MATTLESQVLQILANQVTILNNQATIIQNQSTALTAIQGIQGADGAAITTALAQMEGQLADIQSQVDVATTAATQPVTGGTNTTGAAAGGTTS